MTLTSLPKISVRQAKRVGRGYGSGKGGHTTGRGSKGQKSRTKIPQRFEGTKTKKSFIKRLPFLRGKNRFKAWGQKYQSVNLDQLADWPKNQVVNQENLVKQRIIKSRSLPVKILGRGKINQILTFKVAVSQSARDLILKAGGKVEAL